MSKNTEISPDTVAKIAAELMAAWIIYKGGSGWEDPKTYKHYVHIAYEICRLAASKCSEVDNEW